MRSRSLILCLVVSLLLSVTPLGAAPRDERPDRPFDRIMRIIKKFVGTITTGDALIPPTP